MNALRWLLRSCRALASKASGEARVSAAIPSGHSPLAPSPITVNLYVSVSGADDITDFARIVAHEVDRMLAEEYAAQRGLVS